MLRALAFALLLAATTLVATASFAEASACGTDTSSGVAVTCHLGGQACTATVGADGRVSTTCDPPIIVCVREPCP
jgi:hypothetical protein